MNEVSRFWNLLAIVTEAARTKWRVLKEFGSKSMIRFNQRNFKLSKKTTNL